MIENSDLFIIFGVEGLEPWVEQVLPDGHNLNVLYLATDEMMEIDSVTGDPNPHLWMSPVITKTFVQNITNEVILLDFEHQAQYELNRDDYLSELDDLITMIDNENQFEGLKVVVHHPSFMYLLDLLGIERVGVIDAENVSIIITQPQIEEKMIIQIARDTGAKLAKLTPLLGINDINTYIDMIEYNLLALSNTEEVTGGGWIVTAIIIGSSLFAVTAAIMIYFRYIKK
jgi:ABC-type Zn uptake system ZnuABC Zn-binding protein ZnuA